jgi:SAM-dependent methyltransferase
MENQNKPPQDIRTTVREHYGQIVESFQPASKSGCGCAPQSSACCAPDDSAYFANLEQPLSLYQAPEVADLPVEVTGLSLGCGDPITLASLQPGQSVLDLGSGGGIDCFLAAQRVGPTGSVIGVDMTPSMLEKARSNRAKVGLQNVEFRLGEIEHLPVADASIDVIISNCVINLSPDKPQVFREAYRVLRSGGKLAVSDIVTNGPLDQAIKSSLSAWAGCVAGALEVDEYLAGIREAGFVDVSLTPVYLDKAMIDDAVAQLGETIDLSQTPQESLYHSVFSAKITAHKP